MKPLILIVEDEPAIRELITLNLVDAGYEVDGVPDAATAQARIANALPSLLLLDWMLPGQSGFALAQALRADVRTKDLPIIMVTARTDEADRIAGLESWVDDYVTKPFSVRELKARVKAVLRRRAPDVSLQLLRAGALTLDPGAHRVTVGDRVVPLGPIEFRLLHLLLARRDRALTRGQVVAEIWGSRVDVEERTVDVHVRRLRVALEPFGQDGLVETVRGTGYRLALPN